jgi:hypothetical protein
VTLILKNSSREINRGIPRHLSDVLDDWRGSLQLFPVNKCRNSHWPIPFFGNPATSVVATVGVNPSAGEFHPRRNWQPVQDIRAWKVRLRDYFSGDVPAHRWFIPWRAGLKLLEVSYEDASAAHFDVSYRPTTAMLRNPATDRREFRAMVERDVAWFFRLLPLCPHLRGLLVFGPVVRADGTTERLAGFIRKSAPRHGFRVLPDGGIACELARQPPKQLFLHEVPATGVGSVKDQVLKNLTRNRECLNRRIQFPEQ